MNPRVDVFTLPTTTERTVVTAVLTDYESHTRNNLEAFLLLLDNAWYIRTFIDTFTVDELDNLLGKPVDVYIGNGKVFMIKPATGGTA